MEMAETFTADIVTGAIKSCRNSKAFSPDKLSIFHLKNLGLSTSPPSSASLKWMVWGGVCAPEKQGRVSVPTKYTLSYYCYEVNQLA